MKIDRVILCRVMIGVVTFCAMVGAARYVFAGPYLEIGAYMHHTEWDSVVSDRSDDGDGEWRNPLGKIEVGYSFEGKLRGLSFGVTHFSSMQERDPGLNMIGVKWRWE